MRIKDLPSGTLASSDQMPVDNSTNGTRRISPKDVHKPLKVTFSGVSSLPQAKSVTGLTTDHELIYCEMSNPSAILDGTATWSNGSVTISGTMGSGSTDVILKLMLF